MNEPEKFTQIGWIAHGMNETRHDAYKAMFKRGRNGTGEVRVPPKIYLTEGIANRYGKARPVYIKEEE
jgi:hypothetical protein